MSESDQAVGGVELVGPRESPFVSSAADRELQSPPVAAVSVSWTELGFGVFALLCWFLLFGGGILIGTEKHRTAITAGAAWPDTLKSGLVVFCFWTITNVGLLGCFAAFLGAVGRRTRFAMKMGNVATPYVDMIPANVYAHYASAVIRGFSVYGLVLAGLLVLATETFVNPTQSEYLRIASTISVMAFYAGYDPDVLAGMLSRVRRIMDTDGGGVGSVANPDARPAAPQATAPARPPAVPAIHRTLGPNLPSPNMDLPSGRTRIDERLSGS